MSNRPTIIDAKRPGYKAVVGGASEGCVHRRVSYAQLQRLYADVTEHPYEYGSQVSNLATSWNAASSFYGDRDASEVKRLFEVGVDLPGGHADVVPIKLEGEGPAWRWNDEEGDYEHSEFLAGEPDFFLARRIEDAKPGIYIDVELSYVCTTDVELIADFGRWVGKAIQAIQARGFDISLTISTAGSGAYHSERPGRFQTHVTVKRFGESLYARDFNVLFLPEGFRHLLFLAIAMPEHTEGLRVSGGLGRPHGTDWNVDFDPDQRKLSFGSKGFPDRHEKLPVEYLNGQLADIATAF